MASLEQAPDVIGVGYEGRALDQFLQDLLDQGVAILVDVRLTPISRKRGFSKRSLAAALEEHGITYEHLPVLGNPKDNRAGFQGSAQELHAARDRYSELLRGDAAEDALRRIVQLSTRGRVALLCFEAERERCHRHVLLARLAVRVAAPARA